MSLRNAFLLSSTLGLLAWSTMAYGQGPPGGPGGPGGPPLVLMPSVQKDLALTDKQKTQIQKLESSMQQKQRQAFTKGRTANADRRKTRDPMSSLIQERDQELAKILDKTQKARLHQIEFQREGLFATARDDVAKSLKLTKDQSEQIKTILDGMHKAERDAMPPPPEGFPDGGPPGGGFPGAGGPPGDGDFPGGMPPGGQFPEGGPPGGGPPGAGRGRPDMGNDEFRAQMEMMRQEHEKLRETARQQINEVLTAAQKSEFDKLQGKPFDLSSLRPAPGTRPGDAPRSKRGAGRNRGQSKSRSRPGGEQPQGAEEPE